MDELFLEKRKKTFRSLFFLYFMIYFFIGIMPVNIDNLLLYLPKTTKFGVGFVIASTLIVGIISILFFGYYSDKIAEKYSKKKLFVFSNLLWIFGYGLAALSLDYYYYLIFLIISAIGTGAFLPIGFSMIGEFFPPKDRGHKFGLMNFALVLGNGMGIMIGGLMGSYIAGPLGWRLAYILGFILGILTLFNYIFESIEPERGRVEPEFEDFKGEINYNYKITFNNLFELFRRKSIGTILIYVLFSGIATSTLGTWAIFYLTSKIEGINAELTATTIYLLAGAGALPGTILGGKLGDSYLNKGKMKGRVIISIVGVISGVFLALIFYSTPFFTANPLQVVFSYIFFIIIGFLAYMLTSFPVGNQFAIYAELSVPELRSTANAMNGLMVNIGGIIGNLLLSSLIERNISWLSSTISLVLFIWLIGALLWLIPYFYYPRESEKTRKILSERRKELEKSLN